MTKLRFITFFCVLVIFFSLPAFAGEADKHESEDSSKENITPVPIRFYQKYISPVDGDRCAMYPSCSHYAADAVNEHGIIKGWVMTCDRLIRCGRDEVNLSDTVWVNGKKHVYDPTSNNNFWW
ncbi:MAG: membrane protein insertion efficiency factor YidD [Desulfobacterales bacterium]|nr:membrane protein insertion efficiency factor YidD [Desulfobacterales bacterium]